MSKPEPEVLELKEDFEILQEGSSYSLPKYRMTEDGIKRLAGPTVYIPFVRGSKKGEGIEAQDGVLHETLLAMMIEDLKHKNKLVPSRETSITITKLQEALGWQRQRQVNRQRDDVAGTYQPTKEQIQETAEKVENNKLNKNKSTSYGIN